MLIERTSTRPAKRPVIDQRPRILCIDDDPDIHTSIALRMREFDVEVDHAYYGMQGIVETIRSCPDLILTDLAMPNGDGSYLVETVKHHPNTAAVPVIVLTGMRDRKVKSRVLRDGADVFLQKPVRFDELLLHMRRFVELRTRDEDAAL